MSESTNEKIKNCKVCKKALIDETVPICLRCRLKGKKGVTDFGKAAGIGAFVIALGAAIGNSKNGSDENIDTDNYSEDD